MDDKIRAWYDERDCGSLAKSHPFQAALSCAALMDTKRTADILEDKLIDFCKARTKKFTLSINKEKITLCQKEMPNNKVPFSWRSNTKGLAEGIELADDLYASNEALSKKMMKVHSEDIDRLKTALLSAPTQQIPLPAPFPTVELTKPVPQVTASAASGINKFRSAKDQFCAEVWVFKLVQY